MSAPNRSGASLLSGTDVTQPFGLLWAALGLSSSIYGFNASSACREALGMESSSRTLRTRPQEQAAQARAAARAAEQMKAAGEAAQESMPGAGRSDAGAPR